MMMVWPLMAGSFEGPPLKRPEPERMPVPGSGGNVGVDVLFFDLVPACFGEGTLDELFVDTDGLREVAGFKGFV